MTVKVSLTTAETAVHTSLNERLEPGHLRREVWSRIAKDPRFTDVAHIILEHASAMHPGSDPEIIKRYETFIEGATLAAHALLSSGDHEITDPLIEQV